MSYISAITKNEDVIVWERDENGRTEVVYPAPHYFYIDNVNGKYRTIYGDRVSRVECISKSDFYNKRQEYERNGHTLYESDIASEQRVLSMAYYAKPAPKLHITFLDIEVDYNPELGFAGVQNPYAPISSIAMFHEWSNELVVYTVPPEAGWTTERLLEEIGKDVPIPTTYKLRLHVCENELELLNKMIDEISDADVLSGWYSDLFDMPYIAKRMERYKIPLSKLDFRGCKPTWREVFSKAIVDVQTGERKKLGDTIDLEGRIRVDYQLLYKKYEVADKPSYKLASIEQEVGLGLPKLEYQGSLHDLYRKNYGFFTRYNIRDVEILHGFEQKLGYIELANQMYHISTGLFEHVTGTLKLAEFAIINYCHHVLKRVVQNAKPPAVDQQIAGALVLYPQVGLHEFIASIDINSLYPSAIRAINISPETLRGQFREEEKATEAIAKGTFAQLHLTLETGEVVVMSGDEFRDWLKKRKWAVSGFGTVFDQNEQGIIPTILAEWYAMRRKYQAMKKEAEAADDHDKADYYDRLQYVFKIKLNSLYGALTNLYFRFYDLRMGESTTGTGRMILRHQCRKVAEILDGNYNVEFPQYDTPKSASEAGVADAAALGGPVFNGRFMAESVLYGDSVAGDTLIETVKGPRTIESLFTATNKQIDKKEYCFLQDQQALTYDKETKQTCFRPIKYVMRHKTTKQLYRVWITNRQYVDLTEDHSLITYKNTQQRKTSGDFLQETKPTNICSSLLTLPYIPFKGTCQTDYSKHLYTLMGYVMGDGYVDKTKTGGTLLSVGRQDLNVVCSNLLQPLKEDGWISSWYVKPNGHDIQISSVKLRKTLRKHLYEENQKIIPRWLFTDTTENICAFLRGWFSADGWSNNQKVVGLASVNEQHIKDIHRLLLLCGISSTWFTENTPNSYNGQPTGTFSTRLTIRNQKDFYSLVGFIQPRKTKKWNEGRKKQAETRYNLSFAKCLKVQALPPREQYVYDIEVNDTHLFYANEILVHNTDSTYFRTHCTNVQDAVKVADAVAKKVNESYKAFLQQTFLCNEGFDEVIKVGREIISDRGILVDKKRYVLHVVDKEGKPSDSMKVMGLDTKKTTLPRPIADRLNAFVAGYLKGSSWETVAREVVNYKDELRAVKDVMQIGLPKGIHGIEDYERQYRQFGEDTRLPGHVAAAIHYNQCLKEYGDKISPPITNDMKIKVFYLDALHQLGGSKFKSIALPTDIEVVPPWFLENFDIDYDAHIERLVDNPLQNILKAIGKRTPTKQDLLFDDLFG